MKRNTKLFDQIADAIEKEPDRYDQLDYETKTSCGTAYCVAGWAAHLSGYVSTGANFWQLSGGSQPIYIHTLAGDLLGLNDDEATDLFDDEWTPAHPVWDNVPDSLRDIGRGGDI